MGEDHISLVQAFEGNFGNTLAFIYRFFKIYIFIFKKYFLIWNWNTWWCWLVVKLIIAHLFHAFKGATYPMMKVTKVGLTVVAESSLFFFLKHF